MADLSDGVSVGAPIRLWSFGSFLRIVRREAMAREVGSRVCCLAAAVYYWVVVSRAAVSWIIALVVACETLPGRIGWGCSGANVPKR